MSSIWDDDSDPADRRALARHRLTVMCPIMFRPIAAPYIEQICQSATDDEISSILVDVQKLQAAAETGDFVALRDTVKKYGATDEQIEQHLGMFFQRVPQ